MQLAVRRMIALSNGLELPSVGLGTFRATGEAVQTAVKAAVQCGITHIDTAAIYKVCGLGCCCLASQHPLQHVAAAPVLLPCTCLALCCWTHSPQNEADIAAALRDAGIPRSSVFITSKVSPYQQGTAKATAACADILQRLDTDYVDLLLIHWPGVARLDAKSPDNAKLRLETWRVRLHMGWAARTLLL
jgi:diketogulonate reductase-like aldo/keto reductase